MHLRAHFAAALAAAIAGVLALGGTAFAQASQPNLNVRDASGAIVATCAFSQGGARFPCHLVYGKDGSGNLQAILTDTSGRPIVNVNGSVTIQGGNSTAVKTDGSGVVQPISASALPLPANAAQETGGHLAAIDTSTAAGAASAATTASNSGGIATIVTNTTGLAHESGGNLAAAKTDLDAINTATAAGATAANQTNVQAVAGASASKAIGVQGVAGGVAVGVSGTVTANAGTGTFATQDVSDAQVGAGAAPNAAQLAALQYNVSPPALTTGQTVALQGDGAGDLKVQLQAGSATVGSIANGGFAINGTLPAFAATPTVNAAESGSWSVGQSGSWSVGQSGTWTVQPGNAANTTPWLTSLNAGGNTATISAGGALKVDGSAATQPVSGTFWQATQPISAASLPLPAGAAISAKQPALGTAGTPSADVISVQGVTSMTALKVDGSATTQPVSVTSLPLPSGAATAAAQPALNGDGGALAHVTNFPATQAVTGTFWQTTQPVSAASLPLPAGAATSANQPTINGDGGAQSHIMNFPATQAAPLGSASTNGSTTIATGGTFQTLLASNSARKGCLIQNPTTATEPLYVSVGIATGSATLAKAFSLAPGATFRCANGPIVATDNIAVTAPTTAHAFVELDQ
jgi:hypothetical protein